MGEGGFVFSQGYSSDASVQQTVEDQLISNPHCIETYSMLF